jgi:hypothetical protein
MSFFLDLIQGGMSDEEKEYLNMLQRMLNKGEISKQEAEERYREARDSLKFLNNDE